MGGVDQLLELVRAAVGGLGGAQVHAVVAPAAGAGELGDRHQLDHRHAELGERRQVRDRARERALGAERPDVQLVDHRVVQARGAEVAVLPVDAVRVEHPRRPAQPLRLPARAGVGQRRPVEHELVVVARGGVDRRPRGCRSRRPRARGRCRRRAASRVAETRRGTPSGRCAAGTRRAGAGTGTRSRQRRDPAREQVDEAVGVDVDGDLRRSAGPGAANWSTTVRPRHGPWVTSISTGRRSRVSREGSMTAATARASCTGVSSCP